jgi:twitching motility protein PilT
VSNDDQLGDETERGGGVSESKLKRRTQPEPLAVRAESPPQNGPANPPAGGGAVVELNTGQTGGSVRRSTRSLVNDANRAGDPQGLELINFYVRAMMKYQASDLHLKVGRPPLYRINGNLIPAKMDHINVGVLERILNHLLEAPQWDALLRDRSIDFSFPIPEVGRFRGNVFYQRGQLSAVFRMIPLNVPSIDSLGVPKVVKALAKRQRGLLLVTGPTGSGKSTTLAGLIQYLNERKNLHILTIEDPIEFLFRDQLCSINQRELGTDFNELKDALRHGLRQDPDVIVIGEMRDPETIELALTAAETGHLVMSTLHTSDAKQTIDRMIDVFPADAQPQVRIQIASSLVGVVSQALVPRKDSDGRILAAEVMVKSPAIENYIVENQLERINDAIGKSNFYYQMQTMNHDLMNLVEQGKIDAQEALKFSRNPEDLRLRMSGILKEEGY